MSNNHTSGALEAARIIMNGKKEIETEYGRKRLNGIADLIERKTAAPELYEALKDIEGLLWGAFNQLAINNAFYRAREALAKVDGKEVKSTAYNP